MREKIKNGVRHTGNSKRWGGNITASQKKDK